MTNIPIAVHIPVSIDIGHSTGFYQRSSPFRATETVDYLIILDMTIYVSSPSLVYCHYPRYSLFVIPIHANPVILPILVHPSFLHDNPSRQSSINPFIILFAQPVHRRRNLHRHRDLAFDSSSSRRNAAIS
ncbi:hypothetical protein C8J56DRAFT_1038876 [Mycena floridula]|nr:hypothetical protein C8J56DRAFT_1038876 [Mycena floridula]